MLDDRSEPIGSDVTPPEGQRCCGETQHISLMCTVHEGGSYLSESIRGAPVTLDTLCYLWLLFTLSSFFILASLALIGWNSVVRFGVFFRLLELFIRQSRHHDIIYVYIKILVLERTPDM